MSSIAVCPQCFEESPGGSPRCARCGHELVARRGGVRSSRETPLVVGGLPVNPQAMREMRDRLVPRKVTIAGVLVVVAALIVVLQLTPATKKAPTPIQRLHATLVTSDSIGVTWTSSDRPSNGLRYFALRVTEGVPADPVASASLMTTTIADVTGLKPNTAYVVSVTAVATDGRRSPTTAIDVTTMAKP